MVNNEDGCLVDNATMHTILWNKKYFHNLILAKANVTTIYGYANLFEGSGRANIMLPNGTKLQINDALDSNRSNRNLFSFKDICQNRYHIETSSEDNYEFVCITSTISCQKHELEKLHSFSSGLYHAVIRTIEISFTINQKFSNPKNFIFWHDRFRNPRSIIMYRIIKSSHKLQLKNQKICLPTKISCVVCSKKINNLAISNESKFESSKFFERIQEDIYCLICPSCVPFHYLMS